MEDLVTSDDNFFQHKFNTLHGLVSDIDDSLLLSLVSRVARTSDDEGKVIIVGNGGSAAIAAHLAIDLTKAADIRALCFNESSLLTCFSNDYGYENWVSEALQVHCDPNDLVILISSSGESPNILNAAICANEMGVDCVTLSGFSSTNSLRKAGNINLWVNSSDYNLVENTHQIWLLSVVDFLVDARRRKT